MNCKKIERVNDIEARKEMRILYITTVGGMMSFFKELIKTLMDEGHVVDIATNETTSKVPNCYSEWGCKIYSLTTSRSPIKKGNLDAIKQIKNIVSEHKYDIVHCHSPIASVATRLACKSLRKNGVKVVYTAHGFHFYKGAPKKNWLVYYPIEKICAKWTDVLITINKEDYEFAKKKIRAKKIEYVPGVGIDVNKFANIEVDTKQKRRELGIPEDAFLILSVGELNENKNHQIVIKALAEINDSNIHYAIAGKGDKKDELEDLAKQHNVNLHLLGYRSDVAELYKTADLYALPSIREGLNVSIMEAMASGLPIMCSNIRGNLDLVDNNDGWLFNPNNVKSVCDSIKKAQWSDREKLGLFNKNKIKINSFETVNSKMVALYESIKDISL